MTQLASNATISQIITSLQGSVGTLVKKTGVVITPSSTDLPIVLGIYDGTTTSGKISAVNVPVANVLTGTTIAGQTGTMPNNGALNYTPTSSNQSVPSGYTSGGIVNGVNVPANKVLNDTNIAGVQGTMPNNGSPTTTITNQGGSVTVPQGYNPGGTINVNISGLDENSIVAPNIVGGITGKATIASLGGRNYKEGSGTTTALSGSWANAIVSGLTFKPTMVQVTTSAGYFIYSTETAPNAFYLTTSPGSGSGNGSSGYFSSDGFEISAYPANSYFSYRAWG